MRLTPTTRSPCHSEMHRGKGCQRIEFHPHIHIAPGGGLVAFAPFALVLSQQREHLLRKECRWGAGAGHGATCTHPLSTGLL